MNKLQFINISLLHLGSGLFHCPRTNSGRGGDNQFRLHPDPKTKFSLLDFWTGLPITTFGLHTLKEEVEKSSNSFILALKLNW